MSVSENESKSCVDDSYTVEFNLSMFRKVTNIYGRGRDLRTCEQKILYICHVLSQRCKTIETWVVESIGDMICLVKERKKFFPTHIGQQIAIWFVPYNIIFWLRQVWSFPENFSHLWVKSSSLWYLNKCYKES